MKILFVYPVFENLGIEYLSSALKQEGHSAELVFDPCLFNDTLFYNAFLKDICSFKKNVVDRVVKSQADLVCFSVVSDLYFWACEIARAIKKKAKIPIAFGGIHPTAVPEQVISNDFVDYVVVGEGEEALIDLVRRLEQKNDDYQIGNVWFKRNGKIIRNDPRNLIQDLDRLPFPDKDLYSKEYTEFKGQYTIVTSRGCFFSCTYCCNNFLRKLYQGKGNYNRYRSIDNVIAELKLAKEKYKIKSVLFFDEELLLKWDRTKRLLHLYKQKIDLPFWCYVNPQTLSEEKICLLESSGCNEVEMGVQELDPVLNKNILKRNMDLKQLKKIIKRMQKTKIIVAVDIMLGLPTQNEKNLINMVNFLNDNRVDSLFLFWLRYYPKTEMIDIAIKHSALENEILDKTNFICPSPFNIRGSTFNPQFARIANLFYLCLILPKRMIKIIVWGKVYRYFPPVIFKFFFFNFCIFPRLYFIRKLLGKKRTRTFIINRKRFYLYYLYQWLNTLWHELKASLLSLVTR